MKNGGFIGIYWDIGILMGITMVTLKWGATIVVHWKIANLFQLCGGFLKSGDKTYGDGSKPICYHIWGNHYNQFFGIWIWSNCRHRAPALSRSFAVARLDRDHGDLKQKAHKTGAAALGNQKSGCRGSQPCCCTGRIPWTSGILEAKVRGFGGAVPPKKEVVTGKCVHLHRQMMFWWCF